MPWSSDRVGLVSRSKAAAAGAEGGQTSCGSAAAPSAESCAGDGSGDSPGRDGLLVKCNAQKTQPIMGKGKI